MENFDFIMAGGGLAGLSLAYQLCHSSLKNPRILILDSARAGSGERTWSFWADGPVPFSQLAAFRWSRVRFASPSFEAVLDMDPFHYFMIRGEDFYSHVFDFFDGMSNVEIRTENVVRIVSHHDETAEVVTDSGSYFGTWVFDSRFDPAEYVRSGHGRYHTLMQHFTGWIVEAERPVFDPLVPTLFDFNIPQHDEMRFMYVLPFAENRALVEFTLFSANLLSDEEYVQNLEEYIQHAIDPGKWRVVDRERGVIPMTDRPLPRRAGSHVLNIGTRGGRVKASTGYAFHRVQQDTVAIVASLEAHGHPFSIPADGKGFSTLDTMLLQIMYRRGGLCEKVFTGLFQKNPTPLLLRFLDERTSFFETMRIMASVPWFPFIYAWFRTRVLGKV